MQQALHAAAAAGAVDSNTEDDPLYGRKIDGRSMCFAQGKPFVYAADEDGHHMVAEWPNGVIDTHAGLAGTVVRRWLDGREQCFQCVDPATNDGASIPHLGAPDP